MGKLFVTGGSGFIGRHLLGRLDAERFPTVRCLGRDPARMSRLLAGKDNCQAVAGDLLDRASYAPHLDGCSTVVHLAAVTGKAAPQTYDDVNRHGTEVLLEECRNARVSQFLHVSTIAVKYEERRGYFYADSKAASESAVVRSGMRYAIARPTVIAGQDSPLWGSLSKIASLPVVVVPGRGAVRLQPIYIDDLIDCLVTVLEEEMFSDEVFDLGGPEIVAVDELLAILHRSSRSRDPRIVHLPLRPLLVTVGALEKVFSSWMPVTSGQLSLFANDGIAARNEVQKRHASSMKGVREMVELSRPHG